MANIKFSDFTVGNTEGDIDFVVGYKGANNIQISPTNLLASALGNYLPLAGGTMTGDLKLNDAVVAKFGTGDDLRIQHVSGGSGASYIQNYTGDLQIQNRATDKDIIFQSDDGSGSVTEYFRLDGSNVNVSISKQFNWLDSVVASFGNSADLKIFHNGTDSVIQNDIGNLEIQNRQDDGDIVFKSDDGSGGVTTYFFLDGSAGGALPFTVFPDNSNLTFGTGYDLRQYHNGIDSYLDNYEGDLIIRNYADDKDIIFKSDDGFGGVTTYLFLDGSNKRMQFNTDFITGDNNKIVFGNSGDLEIYHNASNSIVENFVGDLILKNSANDKDIIFQSDDGSGGTATYFLLDGSIAPGTGSVFTRFPDNSRVVFGTSSDLQIFHNSTDSFIINNTGDFYISNQGDDKDIIFTCDDGSGGTTTYFKLDGSDEITRFSKDIRISDSVQLQVGDSADLKILHNATDSAIINERGNLEIQQRKDDGDIIFSCDDGSGGITEYFKLDGSTTSLVVSASLGMYFNDGVAARFGTGGDLILYHDGSNSFLENNTGHLFITNGSNDGDVVFKSDDGSGGTATYFALDGGITRTVVYKNFNFQDNVKLEMGTGADLQIYHDGSNSFIADVGTGDLTISADNDLIFKDSSGNLLANMNASNSVELYFGGNKKFETTNGGVKISGVSEYADNTAAIAGGLTTGDVYRTGDLLKIVH